MYNYYRRESVPALEVQIKVIYMKAAIFQMNIEWEDKEKNLLKVERAAAEASQNGADVIFLPEMSLTGFSMNIKATAEADKYTVLQAQGICRKYGIAMGIGWTEQCGAKAKNCYTVLDKRGRILSTYVKIHPFSYSGEDKYFVKGEELTEYKIENICFSTAICYDVRFPELFRGISKNRLVTAVAVPANWPQKREGHWRVLTQARAIENQLYILAVNCVGSIGGVSYSGGSCIIAPDGELVAECGNNEEIVYAGLGYDIEKLRSSFPVYNDRNVNFYKSIL